MNRSSKINPANLSFMRYMGPQARWWDWAVERYRSIRPGSILIADTGDLKRSSVPVITRGKGFTVDLRRRDLQELSAFEPKQGDRSTAGQLFITPKDRGAIQRYQSLLSGTAPFSHAQRNNPSRPPCPACHRRLRIPSGVTIIRCPYCKAQSRVHR